MKVRNGFVSNSSSSSFIVKWKTKNEVDQDTRWHIDRCVDFWEDYLNQETGEWKLTKKEAFARHSDHPLVSLINIEEWTTKDGGVLTTEFFTSMLNDSIRDYGKEASDLVMGILTSPFYELITTYEEE